MAHVSEKTTSGTVSALRRYKRMQRKVRTLLRKTKENAQGFAARMSKGRADGNGKAEKTPAVSNHRADGASKRKKALFDKVQEFKPIVEEVREAGYYLYFRPIESGQDTDVTINGKKLIMIGSNNYMGLTSDPRVKEAAINAIKKFGSGCTGSPLLNGTLDLHKQLEQKLAKFMRKDEALVFSTGMQVNLGTLSVLVGKNDVVFSDRANHASIVDGCRLSFGKMVKFRHNDMEDLERLLKRHQDADGRLIVVDGLYSMEGDLAPLPDITRLAKAYRANVMVDDAHAVGVFGAHGRGTPEHFHVENDVDLIMYTFSKSFASIGGVVAGERDVISFVRHNSRELIFSASMPPASAAGTLKALEIIESEGWRRERLWAITHRMQKEFRKMGFNIGATVSPIVPIILGDNPRTFQMAKRLMEEGVFVNPVVSPAAPPGLSLIRTSYTATHTDEQMDFVLEKIKKVGKEIGII